MEGGIDICSTVKDLVKVNVVYIQRNVKKSYPSDPVPKVWPNIRIYFKFPSKSGWEIFNTSS